MKALNDDEKLKIIEAIRAGLSDSAIKYQFKIDDEQLIIAKSKFKSIKAQRDKTAIAFEIVDSRGLESEETLRLLKSQANNLTNVTSEELANEVAKLTLSVVQQARTIVADDIIEAGILIGIAEKASKVISNIYGEETNSSATFEDFTKKLKA